MLALFEARTVEEGRDHLGRLESAWNWVLADSRGSIAYQMSGRMPKRRSGASGLVPLPGWDEANDWQGFAAPEELPRALNPERGFFVTANQDLNAHGKLQPITCPMAAWRADRIAQVLEANDAWTVDAVRRLQTDVRSLQADAYLQHLLPLIGEGPEAAVLHAWDRSYDAASRGAALFEEFYQALLAEVVAPNVGDAVFRHLVDETAIFPDFFEAFERVLLADESLWFRGRTRSELFLAAWEKAKAQPARAWGEKQTITMTHMLFGGKLPAVLGFDKGPLPYAGGRGTVMQGQVFRSGGRVTSFGPSYRFVADMATEEAHTVLAGGTSDRRFSREYLSDFARWRAGDLKRLTPGKDT
jgi:penicillin amidase